GLNLVGLRRRGFTEETITALRSAYRLLFREGLGVEEAGARIQGELPPLPEGRHFAEFALSSERGLARQELLPRGDFPMSVRIGVIGVGALGRHHVRTVAQTAGATLVGAYDPRAERVAFASEHGGRAFGDASSLVEASDAVIVASPTRTHRSVA